MKKFAVIGDPVAHSLSPKIHAAFGAQTGITLDYQAIQVGSEVLAESLLRFHDEGYDGLNVTVPHKAAVLAGCESLSAAAEQAQAVNTLIRTATGWHGDNTDGLGLIADLAQQGIALADRRIAVLGAGGAAAGILPSLLAAKPAEVVISSRNPWKPEALAEQLGSLGPLRPCTHLALKGDRFDLLINATSVGHQGKFLRIPFPLLADAGVAYDLSYGKAHTPFQNWAQAQGATRILDGFGMLAGQAAIAFERWCGQRPDTTGLREQLTT